MFLKMVVRRVGICDDDEVKDGYKDGGTESTGDDGGVRDDSEDAFYNDCG